MSRKRRDPALPVTCPGCKEQYIKPFVSKHYDYRCKKCHAAKSAAARLADPEKYKERLRISKRKPENKARAKIARLAWMRADSGKQWQMWNSAKVRAREKGLPFNIEVSDVIIPEVCPLLGVPLTRNKKVNRFDSPSLDRLLPAEGYVKGNVAVISNRANAIKNNATADELELIAKNLRLLILQKKLR